uniref:BCNT-C domain-containing protein n=1 Tax=Ananas comosus var. bracteatus TaxID=296719 RepID=A0A6V7PFW7_ANACO|nr:unnamed protein product [Ananas comosus var. bracteatus]
MSNEWDKGGASDGVTQEAKNTPDLMEQFEEYAKARVEDFWKKMNTGLPAKTPKFPMNKPSPTVKQKARKKPYCTQNGTSEEAKKLAAAALAAVRDATFASTAGKGKVEITEVRDFAGQEIEVKKLVDADSKEAAEKAQSAGVAPTALDAILEQIKKKQKLTVLDKTKKDWGEFKEENKGMEEELDAYKKSSNQYLDKVSFLQRPIYENSSVREMRD